MNESIDYEKIFSIIMDAICASFLLFFLYFIKECIITYPDYVNSIK